MQNIWFKQYDGKNIHMQIYTMSPVPIAQMVERPLREREVVGSIPGRAIPKVLKMIPVATLLSIIRQAMALLSLTTNTTNIAQKLKKNKIK